METKLTEQPIKVLDHGYIRYVEHWGKGDAGVNEAGIIEAARQSTQGSFRGWNDTHCTRCDGMGKVTEQKVGDLVRAIPVLPHMRTDMSIQKLECAQCNGLGIVKGDTQLLNFLYSGNPQHATPFEFAGLTVEMQDPIMVIREWHRHRIQSFMEVQFDDGLGIDDTAYNEMSARYAPLPDVNYMPTVERCLMLSKTNKQAGAVKGSDEVTPESAQTWLNKLDGLYKHSQEVYQSGLDAGMPKEIARLAVTVGRYSKMRATTNLRNWLAFLTLRSDPAAQWEIREYSKSLETIIARFFPRTYELFCVRRTFIKSALEKAKKDA